MLGIQFNLKEEIVIKIHPQLRRQHCECFTFSPTWHLSPNMSLCSQLVNHDILNLTKH